MATTTQHAPGTFCWPELSTSDYAGAKKFYTALFGWTVNENDMGGGAMYGMLNHKGQGVGALYNMQKEEISHGVPPHWNSYVSVANADAAAAKVKQLGGTVLKEPFDVMDVGRMAAITDPTGAAFCIWQAKKHYGASVLDEPGSLCWTELYTGDTDKAEKFYTGLFGWRAEAMPMPQMPKPYTIFKRGDKSAGGMMDTLKEWGKVPPHWMVYFAVDDCDKCVAKAQQMGAKVTVPPTDIPITGRFAMLVDPQGAGFSVIKLNPPA